jgi:outer membrane biosynthesis protein TonB
VRVPATAKWVLLALAGLAVAIGVAIAAANLTGQQIGIASESVSAGDSLAPALHVPAEEPEGGGEQPGTDGGETTTTPAEPEPSPGEETTSPAEETAEPPGETGGDDHGGHGSDGDD